LTDAAFDRSMHDALARLSRGEDLTPEAARRAMEIIMEGRATPAQIGGFLMGLRAKGETIEEIAALARVMREKAVRVTTERRPLVDTCGTGGDGASTFNISTTAAFVVAGAGAAVAKHGNRSVSSRCGSADVLVALGVDIEMDVERASRCLDEIGMCFLFAPRFHQATRHAVAPRRELGMRTVFNVLGPLTNPAGAPHQLVGVFEAAATETLARVLGELGSTHALVVSGLDGLDEISLEAPTRISEWRAGAVATREISPESLGLSRAPRAAIVGGDAAENASIVRRILGGEAGPRRDIVVLNAAAALVAADIAADLAEGLALAAESIDSGRARSTLDRLAAFEGARS